MKKYIVSGAILSALLLSGCASKTEVKEEEPTKEAVEKTEKASSKDDETKKSSNELLNPYLKEELDADIEIVYTNQSPNMTHDYGEGLSYQIDEYQVVRVSNMNESKKHYFDDEDEGYVLSYKFTLTNNSDQEVYYSSIDSLVSDDGMDYLPYRDYFVDRKDWLADDSTEHVSLYSKGKSFTGMNAFSMTKAQYEKLMSPSLKVNVPYLNEDGSGRFGEAPIFKIPMNDAGEKKAAVTAEFYQDRMTVDNIADKELFFENLNINQTKKIEGVEITLDGVQYAHITPTEANKERFTNFGDSDLIALTVKMTIKNGGDVPFGKSFTRFLNINDKQGRMLSQGMLEPSSTGLFNPNDKEEVLTVFLFREDEFSIVKKLELEVGPLEDENYKRIFKEKIVTFELPLQ